MAFLKKISENGGRLPVLPAASLLDDIPACALDEEGARRLLQGVAIRGACAPPVVRCFHAGRFLGIACADGEVISPKVNLVRDLIGK
jgi:hypothetical protein